MSEAVLTAPETGTQTGQDQTQQGGQAQQGQQTQQTQVPVTDYRTFIDDKGTITKPDEFFKAAGAPHLAKRFTSVEAMAKSYVNAERMLSNSNKIAVPGDNSTPEEWEAFYSHIRGVKTEEEYAVNVPDDLKDVAMDAAAIKEFKGLMFKNGAPAKAVQAAADYYFKHTGQAIQAANQQREQAHTQAVAALEQQWGPKDGAKYKEQLALAERGAAVAGLTADVLKSTPELSNNPHYIRAMAKIGAMVKEAPAANLRNEGSSTFGGDVAQQIKAIQNDRTHPFWVKTHPDHASAVEHMAALHAKLYPEPAST